MSNQFSRNAMGAAVGAVATGMLAVAFHAGLGGLVWAQNDKTATSAAAKPALTVTLSRPQQQQVSKRLVANGTIAPWQEASVSTEVGGFRLASINAQVGDAVKKGQVLAKLATDGVRIELEAAKAQILEAEALAADAVANANRARSIEKEGFYSAAQLGQIFANEKAALARVQTAKARESSVQRSLKETDILAPDDGLVTSRTATLGAVVPLGAELFRLIRQNRLEWRAEIPAADIGQVQKGMKVMVTAANGYATQGVVRQLAPSADVPSRNVMVFVDLSLKANGSAGVRAGQFAKGEFVLESRNGNAQSWVVPLSAVVVRDGFSYVFVAVPDAKSSNLKVLQTKVQTGERGGVSGKTGAISGGAGGAMADGKKEDQVGGQTPWIEVTSGLKADVQIVTSGVSFLADGDVVRVVKP